MVSSLFWYLDLVKWCEWGLEWGLVTFFSESIPDCGWCPDKSEDWVEVIEYCPTEAAPENPQLMLLLFPWGNQSKTPLDKTSSHYTIWTTCFSNSGSWTRPLWQELNSMIPWMGPAPCFRLLQITPQVWDTSEFGFPKWGGWHIRIQD